MTGSITPCGDWSERPCGWVNFKYQLQECLTDDGRAHSKFADTPTPNCKSQCNVMTCNWLVVDGAICPPIADTSSSYGADIFCNWK